MTSKNEKTESASAAAQRFEAAERKAKAQLDQATRTFAATPATDEAWLPNRNTRDQAQAAYQQAAADLVSARAEVAAEQAEAARREAEARRAQALAEALQAADRERLNADMREVTQLEIHAELEVVRLRQERHALVVRQRAAVVAAQALAGPGVAVPAQVPQSYADAWRARVEAERAGLDASQTWNRVRNTMPGFTDDHVPGANIDAVFPNSERCSTFFAGDMPARMALIKSDVDEAMRQRVARRAAAEGEQSELLARWKAGERQTEKDLARFEELVGIAGVRLRAPNKPARSTVATATTSG